MFKRLALSLVLMGLAAFSLGAGAVAWMSDSATGDVTITAGSPDLQFDINEDCDDDVEYDHSVNGDLNEFEFSWTGVVPGETTTDCITVHNLGDGTLDVWVSHANVVTNPFSEDLRFTYNVPGTPDPDTAECGPARPYSSQYTSGKGCFLLQIDEGESFSFEVSVEYLNDGNQNDQSPSEFTMEAIITGYTPGA